MLIGETNAFFPFPWLLTTEFDSFVKLDEMVFTWNNDVFSSINNEL